MIAMLTDVGATKFANGQLHGKKYVILGMQVSNDQSYVTLPTSGAYAFVRAATRLSGTAIPAAAYFPCTEQVPVQGIVDDNWYVEYGFLLDNTLITPPVLIKDAGIIAQEYSSVDNHWTSAKHYFAGDYVLYLGTTYQAAVDNTNVTPVAGATWTAVVSPIYDSVYDTSMLKTGDPFLMYYVIRPDEPLTIYDTHSIVWRVRIGFTQQSAAVAPILVESDVLGYSETQLAYISALSQEMRSNRDLLTELKAVEKKVGL